MLRDREIKIVIVEDDLYYNKTLKKYIETICNEQIYRKYKFIIKSYLTAHECIEELEDDTDLMLLDYYLVNKDDDEVLTGEDVLDEVNEHCNNCKVIMISSQENPQITEHLKEKGVVQYIDKRVNTKNRIGAEIQKIIQQQYHAA